MSGPLHTAKLVCYQGVDFLETRVFFTSPASGSTDIQNLTPIDFTGCTARMSIRRAADPSSTLLLSLGSGSGLSFVTQTFVPGPPMPAAPNGVSIAITRAQSLAMNSGVPYDNAYYDLLIDQPGSTTLLLMAGPFDLKATVSR